MSMRLLRQAHRSILLQGLLQIFACLKLHKAASRLLRVPVLDNVTGHHLHQGQALKWQTSRRLACRTHNCRQATCREGRLSHRQFRVEDRAHVIFCCVKWDVANEDFVRRPRRQRARGARRGGECAWWDLACLPWSSWQRRQALHCINVQDVTYTRMKSCTYYHWQH